jgi:hypothetical protein
MEEPDGARLRKKQREETRRKARAKEICKDMVSGAVSRLSDAKEKNGGRLPHREMTEVLQSLKDNGAHTTRSTLNKMLKKYIRPNIRPNPLFPPLDVVEVDVELESEVSSLHGVEGVENLAATTSNKKGGRPKGSTRLFIANKSKRCEECKVQIAKDYLQEMTRAKEAGLSRVSPGFLRNLILEKKTENDIPNSYYISEKTIKNRIKRKRLEPPHPGVASPLQDAEESLVQLCIAMGNARQPLTPFEGLQLMNSLIKDQELQEKLKEFKRRRKLGGSEEFLGEVGRSYWQGFMRRHGDRLVTKRGEKFASNRADWSKHVYIKQMYDVIYDEMVGAGVARVLETPKFLDRSGNIVDKEDKFGEAVDIEILHPDYILFGDETGCNTSQKKDGHEGGKKFVVGRGQVPRTSCSTTDHRFTLLPITSASGEVVICVVIFQGKSAEIPANWATGIDTEVQPVRGADGKIRVDSESGNFGKGKYFPGGPTCSYRGKEVPCATFITEGGGISGKILVSILEILDELDVFPRVPGGPVPVLIIDGHESRLDPTFLIYINDDNHIWKVCLGVPYATSYWQVGDSAEQNGTFKVLWYREKAKLVSFKRDHYMPLTINGWDIMPLLNKIFFYSYGRVLTNLNATSERGWSPANRKLLSHPDLLPDEAQIIQDAEQPSNNGAIVSPELNLVSGLSSVVIDRLCQQRERNGGIARRQQNYEDGTDAMTSLDEAKRITSGLLVANGIHSLNNPMVQERIRAKQQEVVDVLAAVVRKKRRDLLDRIKKVGKNRVEKGRGESNGFAHWNNRQLGEYLQYKKNDSDKAMPKTAPPRRLKCLEVMGRASPIASPHASDDDASVTEENEERQENEESIVEMCDVVQTEFSELI